MTTNVNLVFKFQDLASKDANKLFSKLSAAAKGTGKNQEIANRQAARSYQRLESDATRSFKRTSRAREVLGIRSENAIQREIRQTQAAYDRLARSGKLSMRELTRANQAHLKKVRELNAEMGRVSKRQMLGRGVVTSAAAVTAGAYVVGRQATKAMSFDEMLANMANTAYAERNAAGRIQGMKTLERRINHATQLNVGGGTRDQAAAALDAMIAKNTLGLQRSLDFLPQVMKVSTGAGANPLEIANLTSVLAGQGIAKNDGDLKQALNMITAAGQAGGFEIKDMARWLSQQLPLAQKSGINGLDGLQKILTMNQAAILTSGSTDEAGNNVRNLLAKLSSKDTAKDFEKSSGKNLSQFLMAQRIKGVDAVDAWMQIIDREAANNTDLKQALSKLKNNQDPAKQKALLSALNSLSEGTVIGEYFQDMQALSALLAMRNKPIVDQVNRQVGQARQQGGVNQTNFAVMQATSSAKVRALQQANDSSIKSVMDKLTPTIGAVSENFADLANKHPALAGATVMATTSITAMAGAAGLASLSFGKLGMAGGLRGRAGALASTAKRVVPSLAKHAPKLAKGAGGLAVATVARPALNAVFGKDSAASRYGSSAIEGAGIGAVVGSVIPVVGTAAGAAVGGAIGLIGEGIKDYFKAAEPEPMQMDSNIKIGLAPGLQLISQQTASTGNVNTQMDVGNIMTGAL